MRNTSTLRAGPAVCQGAVEPGVGVPWLAGAGTGTIEDVNLPELAAFLRSRRDRVRPGDVGLPHGPRRRVPGLRREEVAQLAGLSADYYTELERGNGAQPSEQTLAALTRALRLSTDERDHLFLLADRRVPASPSASPHPHPALLGLLDRLTTTPAQIITDLHEPLAQNELAAALLGRQPVGRGVETSFVYRWFTDPATRSLHPPEDHEHHSRVFVADLRAAAARRSRDADVIRLVGTLRRRSEEFTRLWDTRDVALRRSDRKRIVHPSLGVIETECHRVSNEDGTQRLLWFTAPPGTEGAAQLELLSVIGTQDIAPRA